MSRTLSLAPLEFDVCGALPAGVTVLEASAGTGKTYTIAGLAARYVADGIPLDRLLLVTFTRAATGELRERVRERLTAVERGLTQALHGPVASDDPVVALLAREDVPRRRERLARAIADFDAATIATTHGFCQEVLGGLGVAGDLEPDVTFVEDLSELVSDTVDDLYVRRFARGGPAAIDRAQASAITRAAIENPTATIVTGEGDVPQMRGRLAVVARSELDRRKRAIGVMSYDDLVTRLVDTLSGPRREAIAAQLAQRFRVVLVDEFQDTDPAQWEIMRRAFGRSGVTLVLIADPKQAIYAFRGADVYAYLEAARGADTQATLGVNWRSDQGLIDAHDALFSGVRLGHEGIAYRQVRAAAGHVAPRLTGAPVSEPLRVRVAMREDLSLTRYGFARNADARRHIAADVAADIVRLLESGARLSGGGVVQPADLAVLVRTNRQAAMIREALQAVGVPAVINGAGSVFATDPAREWLRLLEALERPASVPRAHSAALTDFIGWSADRVAAAGAQDDSPEWEEVHRRLHAWARILRTRGVASLLEAITRTPSVDAAQTALVERMLKQEAGERRLTDLRHVGQLLHEVASLEGLGSSALTGWLRTRIAEAEVDSGDEERSRRLESDAEAVQVLTIHRSKGLEFGIVHLPFLWEPGYIPREAQPVFFHDPAAADARTLDVALEGSTFQEHREQFVREQRGEDLRLAYVALTRARHQVVAWWAGSWDSRNSPLGRLLFARDEAGDVSCDGSHTPADDAVLTRLRRLAQSAPGAISVERSARATARPWRAPARGASALGVSQLGRGLDRRWRRTSYSDITAARHEAWVGSEPEQPLIADEPPGAEMAAVAEPPVPLPAPVPTSASASAPAPLALGEMPAGVEVGTFVHSVLEATDFAAADLDAELSARIAEVGRRRTVEIGPASALTAGLRAVIETPLGPVLPSTRLRDVRRGDRLDELGFELPLVGGDQPAGRLTLARIADVLRAHLGPEDPLAAYPGRLKDPHLRQEMRGYLAGSLDLVVRVPAASGHRFAVLDYKTNWLGGPDEPLRADHYARPALVAEMLRHHYALQALLYGVALHRFLRWRLPGYAPDRHLAGVVYLFVRGMTGRAPATGVFGWPAPPGLIPALSDALEEGERS